MIVSGDPWSCGSDSPWADSGTNLDISRFSKEEKAAC